MPFLPATRTVPNHHPALTDNENPDRIAINHLIGDIGDYTLPIVLVNEEYLPIERKIIFAER